MRQMESGSPAKRRRRAKPSHRSAVFTKPLSTPSFTAAARHATKRTERKLPADSLIPYRPNVPSSPRRQADARRQAVKYHATEIHRDSSTKFVSGSKVDRKRLRQLLAAGARAPIPSAAPYGKYRASSLHANPKVDHGNHGLIGGLGIPLLSNGIAKLPGIKQADLSAGFILNQLERPVHAGASAALAAGGHPLSSHTNPFDAALRGFLGKGPEGYATYGDVARSHGDTGATAVIGGLGGDIALNPASYFTGGAKPVAEALTEGAKTARNLETAARTAGDTAKAAKYAERALKLEAKAKTAPTNRGLQVGFKARAPGSQKTIGFKTSGATSAKMLHGLGADRLGGNLAAPLRARVRATVRHIAPDVKPIAEPLAEWDPYRSLKAISSATARAGRKTAERRGQFYASHLGHGEGEQVANAVEKAPKDAAQAAEIRRTVMQKGVKHTPEYKARLDALPKVKDLEAVAQKARRVRVKAERAAAKAREDLAAAGGRSEVLARNVTGRNMSRGQSILHGGGHGVTQATNDLRKAEHAVADARANQAEAEAAVKAARTMHTEARKQLTREAKDIVARHAANSVSALPAHSISELPTHLQPIASQLEKELAAVADREHHAGVLGALRKNYLPHQLADQIEKRTVSQVAKGGRHQFAKQRKLEGSIKEINHTIAERQIASGVKPEPLLSTSIPNLLADRVGRSASKTAHSEMLQAFIDHGVAKTVGGAHTLDDMRGMDGVYKITQTGLHAIEDRHGFPDTAAALKALKDGEHVVTMPKVIGDLERADRHGAMKTLADNSGGNMFDRVNSGIKTVLTVLNIPAYDLRNLAGDLHNAFIGGMDSRSLGSAARLLKTDIKRQRAEMHMLDPAAFKSGQVISINGVKHDALDFIREAERHGAIHTGYVGAEKHDVASSVLARRAHGESKFTDKRGIHAAAHPVATLRRFGEHRETVPRLGLYISARRRGLGPAEAAKWVNKHLFDYGDLTDTERGLLRRIFPFYTFAARNTRLQAGAVLRNPAPYATYESTRQEAAKAAGLPPGWESQMPDYQQRGIGLPVGRLQNGHAKMIFPNLPMNDLNRVAAGISAIGGHPGQEMQQTFGNVNLMLKAPLELLMNKNTFFNSAIQADKKSVADPTSHYYVRAPDYVGMLPGPVRKLLDIHKTADGNRWPGKVDYLMRLLPQQNFATQVTTAKAGSHGQTGHDALLSQLTGLKFGEWSHPKNEIGRLFDRYDALTLQDRKLKDLGVPTTDPKRQRIRQEASAAYGAALKAEAAAGYKINRPTRRRRSSGITNAGSGVSSGVSNAGAGVKIGGG